MKIQPLLSGILLSVLSFGVAHGVSAVTVDASDNLMKLIGDTANNRVGYSVAVQGDVDGDGYLDLLVNYADDITHTDRAMLYYGSSTGFPETLNPATASATFFGDTGDGYDYGLVVDFAGDVNGDGYDDMLFGDYYAASVAGQVTLVRGSSERFSGTYTLSAIGDGTADLFVGEASADYAGYALTGLGDVNNDGFDDFAIGAHWNDGRKGAVYLFYGSNTNRSGTTNVSAADVKFSGESVDSFAGQAIAGGDLNGDGFDDIIIGAPRYDSYTGRVYVVYGQEATLSSMSLSTADTIFSAEEALDSLGGNIAVANVNGDAYTDLLIGGTEQGVGAITGGAYLVYGQSTELSTANISTADTKFTITSSDGSYAFAIGGDDFNGDGYDDVVFATPNVISASTYVFPGAADNLDSSLEAIADAFLVITPDVATLGQSIVAGDVNGDSYADLFIGSPSDTDGGSSSGAVYQISFFVDADLDGMAGAAGAVDGEDCDDADSDITLIQTYFADLDSDTFGDPDSTVDVCSNTAPEGYVSDATDPNDDDFDNDGFSLADDCDDADSAIHSEFGYYADLDEDGLGDLNNSTTACSFTAPDGYVPDFSDANDDDFDNDGVDTGDDCNDLNNEISALETYYADSDVDTLGDATSSLAACSLTPPEGYVTNTDDTNDDDFDNDNVDTGDDCDDIDSTLTVLVTYYPDTDGDSFGDALAGTGFCALEAPEGYVTNGDDTDDSALGAVNTLSVTDGVVTVYYASGFVQEVTPFVLGASVKAFKSSDGLRWVAVNGKSARVFFEGVEIDRQKLFKKKSNGKSKLKVVSLYDGYDTVVYISSRGRIGRVTVLQLSDDNTFSELHTKKVQLDKKNLKVRLKVNAEKHRLNVRFGAKSHLSKTLWKVLTSGGLKSVEL